MADLAAVWHKIHRADMHHKALESELRSYIDTKPYRLRVVNDHSTLARGVVNEFLVVDHVDPIPLDIPVRIGEIAYQLRSALDQLAWQLVLANGGQPVIKRTAFPILDTAPSVLRIAGGVDPAALAIIEELQPYKRSQDPQTDVLWLLSELNNIDKHRLPIVVAHSFNAIEVTRPNGEVVSIDITMNVPLKLGASVLTSGALVTDEEPVQMQHDIAPLIAFGEGEPCAGESVTEATKRLIDATALAVMRFTQFF